MNATELIVELVLAGLLMLLALVLPGVAAGVSVLPASIDASTLMALAVAAGFMLGVVVDRAADTLLDRWLAYCRLRFAHEDTRKSQRKDLLGGPQLGDCFPEDWMRDQILASGSGAVLDVVNHLRIRIRVARNLVVVIPPLTTSVVVALKPAAAVVSLLVPVLHLGVLFLLVLAADRLKSPQTDDKTHKNTPPSTACVWMSPLIVWFAIQALCVVFTLPDSDLSVTASVFLIGMAITSLAVGAWWRITRTFLATIWNHCRFNMREELASALRGDNHGTLDMGA